jgi:RNA polymerase sigma-70 factor (ECF subfamily)
MSTLAIATNFAAHPNGEGDADVHAAPGFLAWVAQLVHRHRARLLAYSRRRGLDPEEALDAVQDSFISLLKLPEARTIAREGDDALKLLTVLVRHNVLNQRRKRARHHRAHVVMSVEAEPLEDETSEALITRAEELARIEGCILRMAKLQREVIMLSLLDEQPSDEIGKVLGISAGHARVLLHRAREHVRNCPEDGPI